MEATQQKKYVNPDSQALQGAPLREKINSVSFLVVIFTVNMLSRIGMGPMIPRIEIDLNIGHDQAGTLFFFLGVGYCISLVASAFVTRFLSHHRLIILSSLTVGLSLIAAALSQGLWGIRLSLTVVGAAGGFYLPSGVATITSMVRKKDWGKALAMHQLAPNLAYIASPLFAELILGYSSWRMVLMSYGAASICLGLTQIKWGHDPMRKEEDSCSRASALGQILRQPYYWALTGLFVLAIGVNQGLFHMLSLYLTVERGLDPGHGNHLIALSRVIAFAVPLLVGYLLDRFGTMPVLKASILASGLALCFMAWVPNDYIWLGLIFQAMTSVVFFPVGFAAMSQVTTAKTRNLLVSLAIPPAYLLGGGVVPAGIGMLAQAGRFTLGLFILGGLTLGGLFLARLLKPALNSPPEQPEC